MKKYIYTFVCALLFFMVSHAFAAQKFANVYVTTEGQSQYHFLGDLQNFRYFTMPSGDIVLCLTATNVVGLPENGISDRIFAWNFDKDPCSVP